MAATTEHEYDDHDWDKEVEEFEKTKAGVKALSDSGIEKVPRFFICPSLDIRGAAKLQIPIPVIDFEGIGDPIRRTEVIDQIQKVSGSWGFFQMVNHGVPVTVMDSILKATRRFHEQPKEEKMDLYSSDGRQSIRFYCINGKLTKFDVASWRDALGCSFPDDEVNPDAIPHVCRKEIMEYMNHMMKLRDVLSQLLSEALGLPPGFLENMQCMKSSYLTCLYYPPCPEPDQTLGAVEHSDPTVLTILLQDNIGGLQILHDDHWIDVLPVPGALIANIGDFLQLISNDRFKSVEHRVLSRSSRTRLSVACFFHPSGEKSMKPHGPIKELLSEDHLAVYSKIGFIDFVTNYQKKSVRKDHSALSVYKIVN